MLRRLKNLFHLFEAVVATIWYRWPTKKLTVIGVTGTDGKTTTTTLIHHILTSAGYKTAILSTLSSAHATTPGRFAVQRFLRRSADNGCTHVVLEVTSIAIDQHRVWGVDFAIGVLTNIAQNEHLDYHKTFDNYKRAKLKFLDSCRQRVLGPDLKEKDFEKILSVSKLPGDFNRANVMCAAAAAQLLGIGDKVVRNAVATFKLPAGRLEIVIKKPFTVIVDFAHTPQAFAAILPVVKSMVRKNCSLIHVFGATGNRDKSKRPIMAQIAAKYDDFVFLTNEDTYNEDSRKIILEIEQGLIAAGYKNYEKVDDRRSAIEKALAMAEPGDVVILTGVGHQKSMNIAGQEIPWSEQKIVKEMLWKK